MCEKRNELREFPVPTGVALKKKKREQEVNLYERPHNRRKCCDYKSTQKAEGK